jgi:hypothetical protein
MRECSDGNDDTEGTPPPDTETSEYPSEGATNNEGEFIEAKRRRSDRSKRCLSTPDQRTDIKMKRRHKYCHKREREYSTKQRRKEGIMEEVNDRHTRGTKRRAGDITCRHQNVLALNREEGCRDKKEDMMRYLQYSGLKGEIECEELKRLNRNKTFKIGFPS